MCNLSYLFTKLIPEDAQFAKQYARAMELRNEYWADEMIDIADDGHNDWMTRTYGDTEVDVPNPEVTLRVETRKWLMGKSQPKKYGEKVELEHTTDPKAPPVITLKIDNA